MGWVNCAERLPEKSGDYLILFDGNLVENELTIDVGSFHKAGDYVSSGRPESGRTGEERLLDSIMNRPIYAGEDGFYCIDVEDMGHVWMIKPFMWAELPEAPEGYKYQEG